MKKILFLSFCLLLITQANAQEFSAGKLLKMLSLPINKLESQLLDKRYRSIGTEALGDTAIKTYQYRPVIRHGKKKQTDYHLYWSKRHSSLSTSHLKM